MNNETSCKLANGFSLGEKLYAQISFFGIGIIGTIGIIQADWVWVLPYIVFYWYGIPGVVMRHLVCPRCPHIRVYGDCLQLHPKLTKLFMIGTKDTPFSPGERFLFYLIFFLIPVYPLYWLLPQTMLLVPFIIFSLAWYIGQWFYFCKKCRVKVCPFNRVKEENISMT